MSSYFSSRRWRDYALLPTADRSPPLGLGGDKAQCAIFPGLRLPKRYTRLLLASLVSLGVFYFFETSWLGSQQTAEQDLIPFPQVQRIPLDEQNLPPLYQAYREYEDLLSQQYLLNQTEPQKYIFFANHAYGCGWGNVLQEMVFSALLAAEANRGFVWDDYTWNRDTDYSDYNGRPIPSRIPLSTMLAGHILDLGPNTSSNPKTATTPRSISSRVYYQICPENERVLIDKTGVESHLQKLNSTVSLNNDSGKAILDAWLSLLASPEVADARCVEVRTYSDQVFDVWFMGSTRMRDLWETLSNSPVLTEWGWSPLIKRAFARNIQLFASAKDLETSSSSFLGGLWNFIPLRKADPGATSNSKDTQDSNSSITVPILANDSIPLPVLALHIRRGDFKEHCTNLAEWSSTYTGFNSFPEFQERDDFVVPQVVPNKPNARLNGQLARRYDDPAEVPSMDERKRIYARHCFPDVLQISRRVREVVKDYELFVEEREARAMENEGKKGGWRWWSWTGVSKEVPEGTNSQPHSPQNQSGSAEQRRPGPVLGNKLLKKVYIMTNGDRQWLEEVKRALIEDTRSNNPGNGAEYGAGTLEDSWDFDWVWEDVSTSRDLELGWEEKPVAQALDMYVAQRAEVFVGNGFSSLTANIVMLRMKDGFHPIQTRFW